VLVLAALLPASAASAAAPYEELSFIMVKPDGVHRGLIAEIIKRFEQKGYKLVGIKVLVPSKVCNERKCTSSRILIVATGLLPSCDCVQMT
jgi:hypothetical protein